MPNQGHIDGGEALTTDILNSLLAQKGVTGSFDQTQTGVMVWDSVAGKVYRANGSGWDTVVDNDGVAATPSLRTLGTGAQQAAAGNHIHTLSAVGPYFAQGASPLVSATWSGAHTTVLTGAEQVLQTITRIAGGAQRLWTIFGFVNQACSAGSQYHSWQKRLYVNSVQRTNVSIPLRTQGTNDLMNDSPTYYAEVSPPMASWDIELKAIHNSDSYVAPVTIYNKLYMAEVYI